MGWRNYIIIDNLKLVIESNRIVDDIGHYEECALTKMTDEENDDFLVRDDNIDMENVKISDITIGDLVSLYNAYKNVNAITEMHKDKFLLYWLKTKNIKYTIKSEHHIDIQQYIDNGYTILGKY